jgi:hypothetical protein
MAIDITLAALATRMTTTFREQIGNVYRQPCEVDTETAGAAVDLADNRSVSLELAAMPTESTSGQLLPSLTVVVESGPTAIGPFEECARFDVVQYDRGRTINQRIGVVSPAQFLRARWTIAARGTPDPREARFSVLGRASGSAT